MQRLYNVKKGKSLFTLGLVEGESCSGFGCGPRHAAGCHDFCYGRMRILDYYISTAKIPSPFPYRSRASPSVYPRFSLHMPGPSPPPALPPALPPRPFGSVSKFAKKGKFPAIAPPLPTPRLPTRPTRPPRPPLPAPRPALPATFPALQPSATEIIAQWSAIRYNVLSKEIF